MLSRRTFLKGGLLFGGAMMIEGVVLEPRRFRVEEIPIKIRGLHPSLNGFTICQITDVHHSAFVSLEYINSVVDSANALNPGLTVLTGDYVDDGREYMAPAIKALSKLKARHGVISVLGNHDHFIGKGYAQDILASVSIPLLENTHAMIEEKGGAICVGGVKDFLEDEPDAKKTFDGADNDVPRVLLSHHPDYSEFLPEGERIDLVISGHTHGGQVRTPFSWAPVVPSSYGQKYAGGLVKPGKPGGAQVYVSRGVGVVMIPVRLNCPPELTLLRLFAA